jgi:hypothetical protein
MVLTEPCGDHEGCRLFFFQFSRPIIIYRTCRVLSILAISTLSSLRSRLNHSYIQDARRLTLVLDIAILDVLSVPFVTVSCSHDSSVFDMPKDFPQSHWSNASSFYKYQMQRNPA